MVTLYDTLGVHEDATDDEIKRAYRKAAMRAHPDRNQGREAAAHDAFQEIKQAYSILSDPQQRRVYDAVFAQEMEKLREHEAQQAQAARERAEREAQAARERYEKFVAQAMRYAERGHNRDVVFGVLLGRGCDETLAARIADGIAALAAARAQGARASRIDASDETGEAAPGASRTDGSRKTHSDTPPSREAPGDEPAEPDAAAHAGLFTTLWHGMFGLRS
ncbi:MULTISPECIES: J domain-containing protein [Pseudomonadota]|uniref:J domain-containing protein n=1 Tax=Pseudomonadota TaxID=1224 RepID=UPI003F7CDD50